MTKPKILLIDDEAQIRQLMRYALGDTYEIQEAVDGAAGLAAAELFKPDVILLDLRMPGLDGLAVLRKLKAHARTAGVPVVIVSALGETDTMMEGQRSGAADHLIKPFDVNELRRVVHRQLPAQGD